jgi:uncharacterized membrane protein (DUF2068 family)
MDWSLYRCGRAGHITYAPDEPELREHMSARTRSGELWRCLRCGTFVSGQPHGAGAAADAPSLRRGKEIRGEVILRFFAVERVLRFLLFGAIAFGVWRIANDKISVQHGFARDIPLLRALYSQLGLNIAHSHLIGLFQRALELKRSTLKLIAAGLAVFAVIELIEGVGLWLAKRWGEYFAAAVTSLGLPYEIYDLSLKFTYTRIALFLINLGLVLYLVLTKRLFGARGGKEAYEARLRSESVIDEAQKAAAAAVAPALAARPVPAAGSAAGPQPEPPPFAHGAHAAPGPSAQPAQATGPGSGQPGPAATNPPVAVTTSFSQPTVPRAANERGGNTSQ